MKVVSHAATLMLMAAPRGPRFSSADRLASRQSAAIDQLSPQSMNQSASRRRGSSGTEKTRSRKLAIFLRFSCVLYSKDTCFSVIASRIIKSFRTSSHAHLTPNLSARSSRNHCSSQSHFFVNSHRTPTD